MTKRRLSPGHNPPIHDLAITPEPIARGVVDYFAPQGRLLDPARGSGPFYRAMQRHSKDVRWCEIAAGVDFFAYHEPVDWIICNPPWSKLWPYLQHAMTLAPNIVFLVTLPHLVTRKRLREIEATGYGIVEVLRVPQPKAPWPTSGFQLVAAHIRKGAPPLFRWLPPVAVKDAA